MNTFEDSILRVLKGDSVVGAAFLVSDRLVATCAHVVESAGMKVGEKILLCTSDGKEIEAIVEPEFWRDPNTEDISILRLNEPLENIQAVILGSSSGTKGHNFSTFGFPKQGQEITGRGEIVGNAILNDIRLLQLDSRQVTPGFSGAPIFGEATKRVVGMVVAITPPDEYQRLGTTAFAVPSETIREICPELQISDICPYRSLDVFNEEDAPFFFGRERVIQKMIDSLKREPRFLAVLGPSGSGKSSVMRAGLIPALRQGKVPGSDTWGVITIRPASQPFEQLDSAGLSRSQDELENAVRAWLDNHPEKTRLVLVIDQFEEVLVSTPEDIRQQFIKELAQLLVAPIAITIALSLRDDFYSRFLHYAPKLSDWLERGLLNIPPVLEQDELIEIVNVPALAVGLTFERGLEETILVDVAETGRMKGVFRSTILPLLEFTLTQLWDKREHSQLTHHVYRAIGGITGSLTQWADRTYYNFSENEQKLAQRILSDLVHPGDERQGIPDTRKLKLMTEVARNTHGQKVVQKLVQARLLTTRRNEITNQETVELIHEALIYEWGLLRKWISEEYQLLRLREDVRESALEWESHNHDNNFLIHRGSRLENATLFIRYFDLNQLDTDYLNACIDLLEQDEKEIEMREGQVASSLLHRMNNKAGLIQSCARLIKKGKASVNLVDGEDVPDVIDKIDETAGGILQTIIDFRNSFVEASEILEVPNLINSALQKAEIPQSVKVKSYIQDDLPRVRATSNLSEVFLTLIIASIQLMPDGGRIEISAERSDNGDSVNISFKDSGQGIPNSLLDDIFNTNFGLIEGGGIGLWWSRKYINSINGKITVNSELGKGTCFIVTLPNWIATKWGRHLDTNLFSPILIFDNNPHWTKLFKFNLLRDKRRTDIGNAVDIDFASTNTEAIRKLNYRNYKLIIINMQLVDNTQYNTLFEICELSHQSKIVGIGDFIDLDSVNIPMAMNNENSLELANTNQELISVITKYFQ